MQKHEFDPKWWPVKEITYDEEAGAVYLHFHGNERIVKQQIDHTHNVIFDLSTTDKVIGVEILR